MRPPLPDVASVRITAENGALKQSCMAEEEEMMEEMENKERWLGLWYSKHIMWLNIAKDRNIKTYFFILHIAFGY